MIRRWTAILAIGLGTASTSAGANPVEDVTCDLFQLRVAPIESRVSAPQTPQPETPEPSVCTPQALSSCPTHVWFTDYQVDEVVLGEGMFGPIYYLVEQSGEGADRCFPSGTSRVQGFAICPVIEESSGSDDWESNFCGYDNATGDADSMETGATAQQTFHSRSHRACFLATVTTFGPAVANNGANVDSASVCR
jgi:hypothetical protein